ncbi:MAG TPA: hypothetical protein VFH69_10440 [Gemmatimonadota bacterium]|nr:hypothetical protein [Gemmatimonadota bacterium]
MQPISIRVRSAIAAALVASIAASCSSSPVEVDSEAGKGAKLTVSPLQVSFGTSGTSASVTLKNTSKRAFGWTASEGAAWLGLGATSGSLWGGETRTISMSASRSGMAPGTYSTNVTFSTSGGGQGSEVLPVSMTVPSTNPAPAQLSVSPLQVNFGSSGTSATVTLTNMGDASLTWTATESAGWLGLGATSGTVAGRSSHTLSMSANRGSMSAGTYSTSVMISAGAAGSATESVTMTVPTSSPTEVLLSGQLVEQFGGQGLAGMTVQFKGATATTDANGRFAIAGVPTSVASQLTLSGPGVYQRVTYAVSGDALWRVVPTSFDMTAYNDVARQEWSTSTVRWTAPPTIYVDTRPEGFQAGPDLQKWISEVQAQAAAFVSKWSGSTIDPAAVIVTSSPPQDFSAGTIVIHFSESNSDYGNSSSTIGYARISWSSPGSIRGAAIWLRYVRYASDPSKRTGILGHELGHAMGMGHMNGSAPSFMAPSIGSNTDLKPFDVQAAALLYGRAPGNRAPDTDASSSPQGQLVPAAAHVTEWVCVAGEDLPRP